MIIATAGHIDHGKTSLVTAITGQSTDRLPEEKRRGISIELGFAHWRAPERSDHGVLTDPWSFIDVPGHERFVRHMIAGVQHVDAVLMVIAADDGIMPQTREHAAILTLLGAHRWVVALTKVDQVGPDRVRTVHAEIEAWLAQWGIAAPVIATAAPRGLGIKTLIEALIRIEDQKPDIERDDPRCFRLAVDRSFVLQGEGVILTGTVLSGHVEREQRLVVSPSGLEVRVRGIRVAGAPADRAHVGQRCALNVSGPGIERGVIDRGDWLIESPVHRTTRCVDMAVRWLDPAIGTRGLFQGHIHAGTRRASARLSPLREAPQPTVAGADPLSNDSVTVLVRAHLEAEICAAVGDRWIVRSADAAHTLGVAQVLLPHPHITRQRGGMHCRSLRVIEQGIQGVQSASGDDGFRRAYDSLGQLLPHMPCGIAVRDWHAAWLLPPAQSVADDSHALTGLTRLKVRGEDRFFCTTLLEERSQSLLASLADHHRREPGEAGLRYSDWLASLASAERPSLAPLVVERLLGTGQIKRRGEWLSLVNHQVRASAEDERFWLQVQPLLARERSMSVHEMAELLGKTPDAIEAGLTRQALLGRVLRVAPNRYLTLERFDTLVATARELAGLGQLSAAEFNRATGIGRNLSIEVLETLDRLRLTRRRGALRIVVSS